MQSRYEVGDALGRGGMGEVHDAFDRQLGRRVAIKTIRSGQPSERMIARFLREARIQGRLEHPAIPSVHELGTDENGRPYFVMEKLAGTTLAKLLRATPPAPRQRLLRAFADVCLAVELAHVHGVVHRDLKPDNIVLGDFGEVYVLDWGVAKVIGEDDSFDDMTGDDALATRAGVVLGTPGYISPEQGRGEAIDARADVYSLGIVLREILGEEPPPELRQLAAQATASLREDRLATARSLAEGVQRYLDGDRDLTLRRELAAEHLAHARGAFEAGDRSTAMREAGRAVALDPQLGEAGALVSRLMLEPPAETPPAVEVELQRDRKQRLRASARGAQWGFLTFVIFLPQIASKDALGPALVVAVALALFAIGVSARRDISPWWIAVAFAPILVLVGRMLTPSLAAPGMAAVSAAALATMMPTRQSALGLWALMTTSALLPLAAEQLGLVSPTVDAIPGVGLLLHAPLIVDSVSSSPVRSAMFVIVLVGAAVLVSYHVRRSDEEVRRRLHLQAWHVRQLFPDRA
jgi:serine/threonine-protein kinase